VNLLCRARPRFALSWGGGGFLRPTMLSTDSDGSVIVILSTAV
jgi:hypothetical protein